MLFRSQTSVQTTTDTREAKPPSNVNPRKPEQEPKGLAKETQVRRHMCKAKIHTQIARTRKHVERTNLAVNSTEAPTAMPKAKPRAARN